MTYDLLQRRLEDLDHTVKMVRNITDVDEPIYQRAREIDIEYTTLAARETKSFQAVLAQLNFRPATAEPKASSYISQMAEAVAQLLQNGYGYLLDDDIYYDVGKDQTFGNFCGFSERLQLALMKERGGDVDRIGKRSPLDFLLWKGISDPTDPAQWETVIGTGRPGWHIECSVMSQELLGLPFDLHGGGTDLIFPHHECEVAQAAGLAQPELAKSWLHVSPLLCSGEKMSKSLGNLVFAKDLLEDYDSDHIRLALMHYHHRIGGEWQPELLEEAKHLHQTFKKAEAACSKADADRLYTQVSAALDDDINTLEVIDALHRFNDASHKTKGHQATVNTSLHCTKALLGLA